MDYSDLSMTHFSIQRIFIFVVKESLLVECIFFGSFQMCALHFLDGFIYLLYFFPLLFGLVLSVPSGRS